MLVVEERRNHVFWNSSDCEVLLRCRSWQKSWAFRSRRCGATWISWKKSAQPSAPTAACFTPAVRRSCPISTSGSRPSGTKKAIARRAAELIEDGDTLLLDGGSTTYEVARLLVGRPLQW